MVAVPIGGLLNARKVVFVRQKLPLVARRTESCWLGAGASIGSADWATQRSGFIREMHSRNSRSVTRLFEQVFSELNMATENHRSPHVHARAFAACRTCRRDVAITGNNAIVRLRQSDSASFRRTVLMRYAHTWNACCAARISTPRPARANSCSYVVEEVLAGRVAYLKQAAIAVEVFGRKPDFDAVIDPIVRVQAGRLRRSLERYYLLSGDIDAIRIELPKGSYAPVFVDTTDSVRRASHGTARRSGMARRSIVAYPFAVHSRARRNHWRRSCSDELDRRTVPLWHGACHPPARFGASGLPPQRDAGSNCTASFATVTGEAMFAARLIDRNSGQQIWADEFHTRTRPERWSGNAH